MKITSLRKTTLIMFLSIGFLVTSCGSGNETDETSSASDSTEVVDNGDAKCDKNKKCGEDCKKNCANCSHDKDSDTSSSDEMQACEEGACMPGACGGGE